MAPGSIVFPLPKSRNRIGRTDMGVDIGISPGDPVVAIADSKVMGIIRGWYAGQPYMWFKILSGPFRGKYWYAAEQIDFSVRPGQTVSAGQQIGTGRRTGTATEFGWAAASGRTLAQATTGYSEGQQTAAGKSFRQALMGAVSVSPQDVAWKPCTLTWYDPALGGTNSVGGVKDPNASTASGEPYNPHKFTCAAPSRFAFGTKLMFRYRGRTATCKVNDRGGAITGDHFDLSRAAATYLGIINAGKVSAQYARVGASAQPGQGGAGVVRPGGDSPDAGKALQALYEDFLKESKEGDTAFASFTGATQASGGRQLVSILNPLKPLEKGLQGLPNLPGWDPLDLFRHGTDAIQGTADFLKLIGWLLNPRNIARMVEFLIGLSLIYIAIRINLHVYSEAVQERLAGRGKGKGRGKGRGKRGSSGRTGASGRSGRPAKQQRERKQQPAPILPAPKKPKPKSKAAKPKPKSSTAGKVKKVAKRMPK